MPPKRPSVKPTAPEPEISASEKRQRIIDAQAAREAAERADGKLPPLNAPRRPAAPRWRGRPSGAWGGPKPKPAS